MRLYGGDCREFPYDDFQDGLIRARPNGIVEVVIVKDLDGDKLAEVLVSMRSVGTGSARSVDAYRIIGKKIRLAGSVVSLNPRADAIKLLAFKLNPADVGTPQWFQAIEEALHICDAEGHGPTPGSVEWMSAVDMKVLPGQAATGEALVVGTKKWMDVVHMIVFR